MVSFADPPSDESAQWWYGVHVDRVIDGDSFIGRLRLGFGLSREHQRFRLAKVNTPERGQDGYAEAKAFLAERIEGQDVMILSYRDDTGKYGRVVVEVVADGENVNRALLSSEMAVLYP